MPGSVDKARIEEYGWPAVAVVRVRVRGVDVVAQEGRKDTKSNDGVEVKSEKGVRSA